MDGRLGSPRKAHFSLTLRDRDEKVEPSSTLDTFAAILSLPSFLFFFILATRVRANDYFSIDSLDGRSSLSRDHLLIYNDARSIAKINELVYERACTEEFT